MTILKSTSFGIAAAVVLTSLAAPVSAGSLENMERERAIMIETMLSGDIDNTQRQGRLEIARTRLIDLERMVLRDKTLIGKNQPLVRAAFDNYDLTFVVHASVEKNRSVADHWLSEIGLSTQAIMNARTGRR
ncbi:MAG: hypothetical protein O7F69_08570 [Alphaproteobacteria bacterium]|nr:hypothetical protein [Alphaproteobacteria bacterium]MCZ6845937.1 hypothetical protein [Alphaproteobacteria bacterium]